MQERETKKSPRAPDWDKYLNDENYHDFVTYAKGAKMYSLNYWTFVRLAKEAVYKINGVKLVNIEKIERFLEAFVVEEDD